MTNQSAVPLRAISSDGIEEEKAIDSGLWALSLIAAYAGLRADPGAVAHEFDLEERAATSSDIIHAAQKLGLQVQRLSLNPEAGLAEVACPAILKMIDAEYLVVSSADAIDAEILRSGATRSESVPITELLERWTGEVIVARRMPEADGGGEHAGFGVKWLVRALLEYRSVLGVALLASIFLKIFALVSPLVIQVVIDKVLVHNAHSTLLVIIAGLSVIGIFDVLLQYLRHYALTHTAARFDLKLSAKTFEHLLKLPIHYFDNNSAGQITARINEIDSIRGFVVSQQGMMSLIDAPLAIISFAILFTYSSELTFIVTVFLPAFAGIVLWLYPRVLKRFRATFETGAESQQVLVESVIGAHTVKAGAVEPHMLQRWRERRMALATASFRADMAGALGSCSIQLVSKLLSAAVLLFGARMVMQGEMTIGQLIAFTMISTQVVEPIISFGTLWTDLQRLQVSMERLGDILRTAPEPAPAFRSRLPAIRGDIAVRNVSFRYHEDAPDVLKQVSFEINAGEVIGIVGPSGSGKSTLSKLLQRLYLPYQGQIFIDGHDIGKVHPAWLRKQTGVVLQENLLFNRSIRDNIVLASPYSTQERVIEVAQLAGAHEFIEKLPNGYDTLIEERGMNLSGGQRQRIAIARALISDPRILILDEATSAVDYESERIIRENLKEIVRDRTVIIIAHRLMTVRHCTRIIGLENGLIVEEGTHEELLRVDGGLYRRLWQLQQAGM